MFFRNLISWIALIMLAACSKNQVTPPPQGNGLPGTVNLSDTAMRSMEGIYQLTNGAATLGNNFVCKISKTKVSFFSNDHGKFFVLGYGFNVQDSSIHFSGFWRYSQAPTQGLIQGTIARTEGASDIIHGRPFASLLLKGSFTDQNGVSQPIELSFQRPYSDYVRSHEFVIFGHHGVLTVANPPFAQNSLNGILRGQDYGCDGMEFDVRLTRDNVPICIHNKSIDILLTQKSPLSGDYDQYGFAFLENYLLLPDGQKIPSVEQVLTTFVDSTTMKYMWLDVKGNPDVFKYLEPVVRNAYSRAAAKGRNVVIIADIPSKEVIEEYQAWPSYSDLPTMCELSLQDVLENKCEYFGPRYTLGLLPDDVEKAHSMGIKVYSWTLNEEGLIRNYLQNGKFDGFITDYPAYAVYDYYTMF